MYTYSYYAQTGLNLKDNRFLPCFKDTCSLLFHQLPSVVAELLHNFVQLFLRNLYLLIKLTLMFWDKNCVIIKLILCTNMHPICKLFSSVSLTAIDCGRDQQNQCPWLESWLPDRRQSCICPCHRPPLRPPYPIHGALDRSPLAEPKNIQRAK